MSEPTRQCETCGQVFVPLPDTPDEPECPKCVAEWAPGPGRTEGGGTT
jgi:hypothetical protein